ncbi:MAG: NADH-quinone oxidoreductase subunit J [Candidatus Zixiibacteriota bacterium]
MELAIFLITAIVLVITAILVVVQRNPVASALFLIAALCTQAILYLLLKAPFLAVIQIIVYAGAIMVLFLFVIMLLNLRKDEFGPEKRKVQRFFGILFAVILFIEIGALVKLSISGLPQSSGITDPDFGSAQQVGQLLFTDYLFPFEVTSVLLLVAIVGAIVMAKRKL